MATVSTSYTSLAEIQSDYTTIESGTLTLESSLTSVETAFDNIDAYDLMSVDVLTSTRIAGTLTNGDYIDVRGSHLNAFPITITRIDYTFAANGLQLNLEGNISQASEFSDPTGSISRVVVTGAESRLSFSGSIELSAEGDARIDEFEIQAAGNTLNATGSILLSSSLASDGTSQLTVSGSISTLTLSSTTESITITGLALDAGLIFESPSMTFDQLARFVLKGDDVVTGTAGGEYLFAFAGSDSLDAGGGNDTLNGGIGADTMRGGTGDDRYFVDSVSDAVIEVSNALGGGTDTIFSTVSYTLASNVENLVLRTANPLNGTGNALANNLTGNGANNLLKGLASEDVLRGQAGNDSLNGGPGADSMYGGAGNDTYFVDSALDRIYETTTSTSMIDAGGVDLVRSSVSLALGDFVENLILTGMANINGTGNDLNNRIDGSNARNVLAGAAGNDTILGRGGSDRLLGGGGNDNLNGGTGSDTLVGGAGKDIMTGGGGADIFDFNKLNETGVTSQTRDLIADFIVGVDKIDLSNLDANTASAANDAFTGFILADAKFSQAGQLKFVSGAAGGILLGNTDADSAAEFSISLIGVSSLSMSDIVA